jgi:hypothetical protein
MHKLFRTRHGESTSHKENRLLSPIANALGQRASNETGYEIAPVVKALPVSNSTSTFVQRDSAATLRQRFLKGELLRG